MGSLRLSMTMIFVKDLAKMTEFYSNVLGLVPIAEQQWETYVEFESGFALHQIPLEIAKEIQIADPPQPREKAPTKLFFAASNQSAEEARLRTLGVPEIKRPWGTTDWLDPEGNVFTLSSR